MVGIRLVVGSGVLPHRVVAATDMTAGHAHPEVDPLRARLQALEATLRRGFHIGNTIEMSTLGHDTATLTALESVVAHTRSMHTALLLVPSPLLGPSSWQPMADAARDRGHAVAVADLRPALEQDGPLWPEMVRLARSSARALPGTVDVVGHSGGGALLPGIGATMGADLGRLVFVDAVLPPATSAHRYPDRIRDRVTDLAGGDPLLPPWLDWWDPETIAEMLPDPSVVAALRADCPRVPVSWFDESVPVPIAWTDWDAAYVRLSSAYEEEAARAATFGWPTFELESHHLGIVTDPDAVLNAIGA